MTKKHKALIEKVCKKCGSTDVVLDAWACWNPDEEEWVLKDFFDNAFCLDCDCECVITEKEVCDGT